MPLTALFLAALVGGSYANQRVQTALARAPEIAACRSAGQRDLGFWDDAFSYAGRDFIIFRNGPELFSLSLTSSGTPRKLAEIPGLTDSKIVNGVESHGHRWLFFQSATGAPFALDLATLNRVGFPLSDVKIPGNHAIEIQSSAIAVNAGGAMFELSGGDADSWPRPENRPVYYWFSLESGRAVQLPIGWDLLRFSADHRTAVFWKVHGEPVPPGAPEFAGRPVAAVSMSTGEVSVNVPDRTREFSIPFSWTYRDDVKPLQAPYRPELGEREYFAGVSVNGVPYPFAMKLDGYAVHAAAQAEGDWAVFSLRPEGGTVPSTLWWARLRRNEEPRLLAEQPGDFEILGKTRVVYLTSSYAQNGATSEAFVYDVDTGKSWNVLDNLERLPKLDAEIARRGYVWDRMTIRLVRGFGSSGYPALVFSLFSHSRDDIRAAAFLPDRLPSQHWRRALLLSAQGDRCTVDIPEPDSFAKLWLHNSGKLLVAENVWSGSTHKLRVSEIAVGP